MVLNCFKNKKKKNWQHLFLLLKFLKFNFRIKHGKKYSIVESYKYEQHIRTLCLTGIPINKEQIDFAFSSFD